MIRFKLCVVSSFFYNSSDVIFSTAVFSNWAFLGPVGEQGMS